MENEDISFLQTLPKKLVHKDGPDDIFLTSFAERSEDESVLGATLPRAHGFYCEFPVGKRTPDLALLIEICRQACFVVAHQQFDVPLGGNDDKFIMKSLSGEFVDTTPFDADDPVNVMVHCKIERVWRRGGLPSGLIWAFTIYVGDTVVAVSRVTQTWISRAMWKTMRARLRTSRGLPEQMTVAPPAPATELQPGEVGRINPANILLAQVSDTDGGHSALLRADIRHPVMFDHPADYIYAMVQLEGARQLALLAVARRLGVPATNLEMCEVSAEYLAVADFDLPTTVRATLGDPGSSDTVDIEVIQDERRVSSFTVVVRPVA